MEILGRFNGKMDGAKYTGRKDVKRLQKTWDGFEGAPSKKNK